MIRKFFTLMITLALAISLSASALAEPVIIPVRRIAEEGLTFTGDEAFGKALQLLTEHGYDYKKIEYRFNMGSVLLPDGRAAWIVLLQENLRDPADPSHDMYVSFSADDGEVIELYFPEEDDGYTWILTQWMDQKDDLPPNVWDIDEQVLFNWLFSYDSDHFDPSATAVSGDEAIQIAKAWIKEHFGLEFEKATLSYIGSYDDDDTFTHYCWSVSLYEEDAQSWIIFVNTETGEVENSYDVSTGHG